MKQGKIPADVFRVEDAVGISLLDYSKYCVQMILIKNDELSASFTVNRVMEECMGESQFFLLHEDMVNQALKRGVFSFFLFFSLSDLVTARTKKMNVYRDIVKLTNSLIIDTHW